jgi:hypothetical protein
MIYTPKELANALHVVADTKARKEIPLATGVFDYFPDALIAVARLSMKANTRHNPGEYLHWSKGKSNDHDNCAMRHFVDRGKFDAEWGESHTVEYAWRALARLQTEIEASRVGMTYDEYVKYLTKQEEANAVHSSRETVPAGVVHPEVGG